MKSKLIEFLTKLEKLLAEYDAEISFQASDCSDWHGMSDERMEISVKDCEEEFGFADFPEEVKNFIHGKAYKEGHAYGFSEIANKYDDLVEFVNVCKEAFTNA